MRQSELRAPWPTSAVDLEDSASVAYDLTPLTRPLSFWEFPAKRRRKFTKTRGTTLRKNPAVSRTTSGRDELPTMVTGAESLSFGLRR